VDDTKVGLRAAVRALADVVSPAVDPLNAQAKEQLQLTIDYIEFALERLDHFHDRALFDLRHHLEMAKAVQEDLASLGAPSGETLAAAIQAGMDALPTRSDSLQTLREATAALAAAISTLVRDAPALEDAVRRKIEESVLKASEVRIDFERSWYLPLGLDHDPGHVRNMAEYFK